MDTVNQATAECFNALTQLRELDTPIGSPDMIHNRLIGFVDAMREKARDIGVSQRDADDMAYAIVALCDEIAMGKPEPMRGNERRKVGHSRHEGTEGGEDAEKRLPSSQGELSLHHDRLAPPVEPVPLIDAEVVQLLHRDALHALRPTVWSWGDALHG